MGGEGAAELYNLQKGGGGGGGGVVGEAHPPTLSPSRALIVSYILLDSIIVFMRCKTRRRAGQEKFRPPNTFVLYGDPAYPLRQHLLTPYRGAMLTPAQELFNKKMSKVRESVEWALCKVIQYFAFLDFRKNQKVLLQPIVKYYAVGVLLINCHSCLYGSVTASYFCIPPPDLHTYLSG